MNFSKNDLDKQESIIFKRQYWMEDRSERRECPQPLRFLYVGREPIHKALPSAAYLGEDRVLNRACHVFLFAQVRWEIPQDHVYYLDKATSVPLKLASYRDQTARDQKKPLWVWTAESLDKVQDHFVSLKSKMIQYAEDLQPGFTWTYSVISIQFDKDYPASMFSPAPQPGVTVLDSINSKRTRRRHQARTSRQVHPSPEGVRTDSGRPPQRLDRDDFELHIRAWCDHLSRGRDPAVAPQIGPRVMNAAEAESFAAT